MDKKKHILITGASSGIGQALAQQIAKESFLLSLCGRNEEKLQKTLALLPDKRIYSESFCLTNKKHTEGFIKRAIKTHGDIDVLVNCAGLNNVRKAGIETELSELDWLMEVNCYAPIHCMQTVVPAMQSRKLGTVINVLSTACHFSNPGIAAYTASKAALDAYTKVMRKELRKDNIKMLSVYPGGVDTPFREAERPEYLKAEDVAEAIFNLMLTAEHAHVHELIIRPQSEENFS
ncbi:putative oxidoreductase [Alteromonas sp. KUL17]|uniref:SDR family oxidoreductase n=1 Tax=Alteromonas sp. KUL17 TaxID=2480796 RepID=UPI00103782BB|nr:SDR family oxidoreductase [Alteromonas sp. KUL17]TAP29835.1 SDR family oxidoreductase [Alteromonas sp. KUL17]GEA02239.1 putative oxidoreductase [Alteromonas sp. KUL17]